MIPQPVVDFYLKRYHHLTHVAASAQAGHTQARLAFARNALRLEAPTGVSMRDLWNLAGVAEGKPWSAEAGTPEHHR